MRLFLIGRLPVRRAAALVLSIWILSLALDAAAQTIVRDPVRIFGIGLVAAAKWSPDGTKIAIASNNFVAIYNAATGAPIRTILDRNTGGGVLGEPQVRSLAYSPDGKLLATGNERGEARIWDAASGALKRTLIVKAAGSSEGTVKGIGFSYDSKYLVTALGYSQWGSPLTSGTLKLWDAATGGLKRTYARADHFVALACSPKKMEFATIDGSGITRLWNNSQNDQVWNFESDFYNVTGRDVAYSPDGAAVAACVGNTGDFGSHDAAILWNSNNKSSIHSFIEDTDGAYCVAFASNSQSLVVGGKSKAKRFSAAAGYGLQKTFTALEGNVADCSFSPDAGSAKLLAGTNAWGGEVRVLNTSTGNKIYTIHGHSRGVKSLALMPDSSKLLTGADSDVETKESSQARVYETNTGRELFLINNTSGSAIVDISPDGKSLMTATFGNGLKLWNATGGLIREIKEKNSQGQWVPVYSADAAFAAGGAKVVSGVSDTHGFVNIFLAANGYKEKVVRPLDDEFTDLSTYSGKLGSVFLAGTRILGSTYSGKAYLYDMTGTLMPSPIDYAGWIYSTAISPTGKHLAIGGSNGVVLWDIKKGKQLYNLPSQGFATVFSPDGFYLAAGDGWKYDNYGNNGYGRVQVWEVNTGKLYKTLCMQKSTVMGLIYSPDGTALLSGSLDGTVALWGGLPQRNAAGGAWRIYQ